MHRMTPEVSDNFKSTLYALNTHFRGPNVTPFILRPAGVFLDTRLSKIGPQALNCQKYPVYTEQSPWGPNFTPFCSTTSHFRDTVLSKFGNAPNDPQNDLNHLTVKSTLYTLNTHQRPKFHPISLYDEACSRFKVVENQNCTEWPQIDLKLFTCKGTLYAPNAHHRRPNFNPLYCTANHFRVKG